MSLYVLVFLGSGLGGLARYFSYIWIYRLLGTGYPYGTLAVNMIGSLFMGIFFELIFEHFMAYSGHFKAFFMIGFLGGFTTFSAFSLDVFEFFQLGNIYKGTIYILLQVILSLLALMLGVKLVKVGG
jgi:CrcB protein